MKIKRVFGITILTLVLLTAFVQAENKSGEAINWHVISGGGTIDGISTNYNLSGSVSQTAVGSGTSTNYGLGHGFWQGFPTGSANCCDFPGDANNNAAVNILDVTYLIAYLYSGGPAPICLYEGDPNANCAINILDITFLIAYLYSGGSAPNCASICPGW